MPHFCLLVADDFHQRVNKNQLITATRVQKRDFSNFYNMGFGFGTFGWSGKEKYENQVKTIRN